MGEASYSTFAIIMLLAPFRAAINISFLGKRTVELVNHNKVENFKVDKRNAQIKWITRRYTRTDLEFALLLGTTESMVLFAKCCILRIGT